MLRVKCILIAAVLVFVAFATVSCGDTASNNDQGRSFLALGFFSGATGGAAETGRVVPLFTDDSQLTAGAIPVDGQALFTFVGLQNRLVKQFIRVTRVDCNYDIQGASPLLRVPSESFSRTAVLGPQRGATTAGAGTIPGDQSGADATIPSTFYMQVQLVSTSLFSFLNVNQNLLPQLPFRMTALCKAIGVLESGDVLESNIITYEVTFADPSECCTSGNPGDTVPGVGPGTGGDPDTFNNDGASGVGAAA